MLPRAARLKRKRDFNAVYARRKSYAQECLVLYIRFRGAGDEGVPSRIGFVISKKVAKRAHDRNRLKRRLREICRLSLLPRVRSGRSFDMLLVARAGATDWEYARLAATVETLGRQAGLL